MNTQTDPLTSRYIQMTRRLPKLTRDEEAELVRQWIDTGDRNAAERLTNAHLRDVVFMALRNRYYGVPIGELISEGNLGLLHGLDKYDPEHGTRFGTYAAYWIRAYMMTYILKSWSLVGGASGVMRTKIFFKLRRERARMYNLHGEGPDADRELAKQLGLSEERVQTLIGRLDHRDVSLDTPMHANGSPLIDSLIGDLDQEAAMARHEVNERVSRHLSDVIDLLDERERFIVQRRFLADRESALSLAEVGREFGVSRERARQLEVRAKAKLRQTLTERCGSDVVASADFEPLDAVA